MAKPFLNTTRSLRADSFRAKVIGTLVLFLFLGAWVWWFFTGEVATYETTQAGRVEVASKAFRLDAPIAAPIASHSLEVGRRVERGEVLLRYEHEQARLELEQERTSLGNNRERLTAIDREASAAREALERSLAEAETQIRKSEAAVAESETNNKLKAEVVARYETLYKDRLISELEVLAARMAREEAGSTLAKLKHDLQLHRSHKSGISHQLAVEAARLQGARTTIEGEIAANEAMIKRLELALAERSVRAPVSGVIGEVAPLSEGAYLTAGERICTIVPEGELRIYADFPPAMAVGRIRPGQPARIRLDGFPWTQYGSIQAKVKQVGNEVREGYIQVDFALVGDIPEHIPVQHGLPGTVEVEVSKYSPFVMLLRAVGKFLDGDDHP